MADAKADAPVEETPVDTGVDEAETSTEDKGDPFDALEEDDTAFDDSDDDDSTDEAEEDTESDKDSKESEEESTEDATEEKPDEDEPEEEDKKADTEEAEEVESDGEEDTTSDVEEPEDKNQKELAHEAFKRREAERQLRETKATNEKANLDRYLKEAEGDEDELRKRQNEVETFNIQRERIELNQQSLDVSIRRAASELGIDKADAQTKDYIARQLDKFETMHVQKDKDGNPIKVTGDVYQYLKEEMDSIGQFRNIGAREQTKKKQAEKTRTVTKPTRQPKEAKKDQDLEDFDTEFDSVN